MMMMQTRHQTPISKVLICLVLISSTFNHHSIVIDASTSRLTFLLPRGGSDNNDPPPPPPLSSDNKKDATDTNYYDRDDYLRYSNDKQQQQQQPEPDNKSNSNTLRSDGTILERRDYPYGEQTTTGGPSTIDNDDLSSSSTSRQTTPPSSYHYPQDHGRQQEPQQLDGPPPLYDRRYIQQQQQQQQRHHGGEGTQPPPQLTNDHRMYNEQQRQPPPRGDYYPPQQDIPSRSRRPPPPYYGQQQQQQHHHPYDQQQQQQQPPPHYQNANTITTNRHLPPPDLPDDIMDDMDDLPPASYDRPPSSFDTNPLTAGATSASTATTDDTATAAGGGLDLSQFDKDLIFSGLKRLYRKKILPLELSSKYGHFHSPPLSPSDFEAKPMVLLVGQYSVGKTSFIKYLLGRDFPGSRIGPEPTTDRFTSIMLGDDDKIVPGAALCSQADRPYRGLSPFGNNFLSRFEGVEMDAPILQNITLVDTPGILSGQKQQMGRNYDYEQVMKWFIERADLIIIMFDAHKLDISDELKRVIELMIPHQDKIRVVLNKADSISTQQLMRVYGALMWSLGKVMMTPEVCRVFMSSFWENPLKNTDQASLLTQEKMDLFRDISQLPQNAVMRRINELVKRARSVKVHAYIIHYLRKQLPYTWGKREKQRKLIGRLDREFVMCARRYELPKGDFPPLEPFRQALLEIKDLSEFSKLDKKLVKEMDKVFSVDIPELLERARQF